MGIRGSELKLLLVICSISAPLKLTVSCLRGSLKVSFLDMKAKGG